MDDGSPGAILILGDWAVNESGVGSGTDLPLGVRAESNVLKSSLTNELGILLVVQLVSLVQNPVVVISHSLFGGASDSVMVHQDTDGISHLGVGGKTGLLLLSRGGIVDDVQRVEQGGGIVGGGGASGILLSIGPRGEVSGPVVSSTGTVWEHVIGLGRPLVTSLSQGIDVVRRSGVPEVVSVTVLLVHILDHVVQVGEHPVSIDVLEVITENDEQLIRSGMLDTVLELIDEISGPRWSVVVLV